MNRLIKDIKSNILGISLAVLTLIVLDMIFGTCCPLRIITGLPCPACGTIRSVTALFHLQFKQALWYQPLLPFLIIFFMYFCKARYIDNKSLALFTKYAIILCIGSILVYVVRMFLFYPDVPPLEYTENNLLEQFFHRK